MQRFKAAIAGVLAMTIVLGASAVEAQETPPAPAPSALETPAPEAGPAQPEAPPRRSSRRLRRVRPAPAIAASPVPLAPIPTALAAPPRPGARLAPGTPIPPAELEAFVDGVVRQAMASDHIAGVAVSVVQNGQVVLKKGYGYDRQSPVRAVDPDQTLFRLGSISKTFTWIAVMKQVEGRRMGLANPINPYLPQRLQIPEQGYGRDITVLDLMGHVAGFEDRAMGQLFEREPGRIRPLATYLRQERPQRVRPAGALPVYSNYGAALAGEAASEVAGVPFNRLIEQDVFLPLGMTQTTFREPYPARRDLPEPMKPAMARKVSQGFRWADGRLQPRDFEYLTHIGPAGAASSTAADMARYMTLLLGDGTVGLVTVYSPRTAQAFRTVHARSAPGVNGWAHGFHEQRLPGGFTGFGHHGATLSFRTNLITVPALGLGVFTSANTETADDLTRRLPQLIVERFYGGPRVLPAASAQLYRQRGDYAGVYLTERRAFSGLEKFLGVLTGSARVDVSSDGRLVTTIGDEARSWIALGGDRFQATDGPEVSVFDRRNGRASRWFASSGGDSYNRAGILSTVSTLNTAGLLALVAAIATLVGLITRDRRDFRQTSIQSRASAIQTAAAVLWIVAAGCLALWAARAGADTARAVYEWPGPWLLIASACSLVASLLTLFAGILLPAIWKGGRRLDSWTVGRKLRFTATTAAFAALAVVLAVNGALEPWSG